MTDQYNSNIIRVVIAQICKNVGYDKIEASSLAVLEDVLHNFLKAFGRDLHAATEFANRTEVSLKDLLFCFGIQNICIGDLCEFLNGYESVPCVMNISQYPIQRMSSLTFIDDSNKEVAKPQSETEASESECVIFE